MKPLTLISIVALLTAGCVFKSESPRVEGHIIKLDESMGVLISIPEDFQSEGESYPNSGRLTAYAVEVAFARHAAGTDVTKGCHGNDCLEATDPEEFGYYIMPEIITWEDEADEWSGKPDRVVVQLAIFDTATKSELTRFTYVGNSQWAATGGEHPQDLLPDASKQAIALLYK